MIYYHSARASGKLLATLNIAALGVHIGMACPGPRVWPLRKQISRILGVSSKGPEWKRHSIKVQAGRLTIFNMKSERKPDRGAKWHLVGIDEIKAMSYGQIERIITSAKAESPEENDARVS